MSGLGMLSPPEEGLHSDVETDRALSTPLTGNSSRQSTFDTVPQDDKHSPCSLDDVQPVAQTQSSRILQGDVNRIRDSQDGPHWDSRDCPQKSPRASTKTYPPGSSSGFTSITRSDSESSSSCSMLDDHVEMVLITAVDEMREECRIKLEERDDKIKKQEDSIKNLQLELSLGGVANLRYGVLQHKMTAERLATTLKERESMMEMMRQKHEVDGVAKDKIIQTLQLTISEKEALLFGNHCEQLDLEEELHLVSTDRVLIQNQLIILSCSVGFGLMVFGMVLILLYCSFRFRALQSKIEKDLKWRICRDREGVSSMSSIKEEPEGQEQDEFELVVHPRVVFNLNRGKWPPEPFDASMKNTAAINDTLMDDVIDEMMSDGLDGVDASTEGFAVTD